MLLKNNLCNLNRIYRLQPRLINPGILRLSQIKFYFLFKYFSPVLKYVKYRYLILVILSIKLLKFQFTLKHWKNGVFHFLIFPSLFIDLYNRNNLIFFIVIIYLFKQAQVVI